MAGVIDLKEKSTLSSKELKKLINNHQNGNDLKEMVKAAKYYENENDVLNLDFREYKVNGATRKNENRSNQRIPNNFFKLIVDQLVSYALGKGVSYKHDDKTFTEYLDQKLLYDFDETLSLWLEESRIKKRAYVHFYYDEVGTLEFAIIPSEQIIPIYKDEFKKKLKNIVRYYSFTTLNDKNEEVTRRKVEYWTDKFVEYYQEDEHGEYTFLEQKGHWSMSITTKPGVKELHSWGALPFIELRTGIKGISDLNDIKLYVDAYDVLLSEFVNQLADVREILIKVLGYSGQKADEILSIFRSTGIVKIDDKSGNIDVLKSEIPVEARAMALKMLEDNIYKMGKGVNSNPEKYGTAISGVAIAMMYRPLDMKADSAILSMKKALGQFMWFLVDDYNRNFTGSINPIDVKITFNKNTIEDFVATAEGLSKLKGIISNETIWGMIPGVDPAEEAKKMEKQEGQELETFNKTVMNNQ